ncbi:unnamed protein product [Phytophthora lilii]|uniref:Unnamed protein product n=1 Tax=Phytophthora lilii TaxID=2077276 RepID=A0A9W6UBX9_9STRA|nr:unnamed protein product [Phytophthora lilii]
MVHAVDTAAKNGHFETLQWLHSTQLFKCTTAALNGAAENGHFEIVKWLHQTENEVSKDALSYAAMNGHFEIVKWLYNNIRISFYGYGVKFAARHGRLDIVQWFHEYYPHSFSEEPMNLAALGGQMEVLTWLHEHRSEGCTEAASYYAARNGHLNVVQWLHEHYSSKFDVSVMDQAALNGHLHIVRWLHENRSEGCSKRAMGSAADNGHLDVMLYLLENRSEGFYGNAMETPQNIEILCLFRNMDSDDSRSGSQSNQQQLQRLKVVFEERPDFCRGCLRSLAEIACEKGNFKILDWLTPFGLELRSTIPIRNAVRGGDLALVRWFYRNGYKVDEPDLLELALDVDVARWLYEHGHQITSHELVETAARRQNGPLMRWLIEHGPPLDIATATTLMTEYPYFEVTWKLAEKDRVCMVLELLRNNNDNNLDSIWWILRYTEIKD